MISSDRFCGDGTGRRHVQVRVVEPVTSSVNSGDCFVVVTPTDVIQWMGQFANVIERAKCSDVAQRILIKKDFGCLKAEQVSLSLSLSLSLSFSLFLCPVRLFHSYRR